MTQPTLDLAGPTEMRGETAVPPGGGPPVDAPIACRTASVPSELPLSIKCVFVAGDSQEEA